MEDSFKIKKKKREELIKQHTSLENSADEVEKVAKKASRAKAPLSLPEINTDKIFEAILAEASRDNTVFTTVNSIINMARRELVS